MEWRVFKDKKDIIGIRETTKKMKGDLKCQDRERVLVREGNQYKAGKTAVILANLQQLLRKVKFSCKHFDWFSQVFVDVEGNTN